MNRFVTCVWAVTLVVAIVGVVPLVVGYLNRILSIARQIERYTEDIQHAGAGIARNTSSITALRETIALAGALAGGARAIERDTAAIAAALAPAGEPAVEKGSAT